MTSCAVKPSPPRSCLARLPSPARMMVGVKDTAGWQTRPSRCARQQDQALIMLRTSIPSRRQRISQGTLRNPLPQSGHCQHCFLVPRTPDTHRRLPPPTVHQAPDVNDRDLVCLALASPLLCRQAVGYRPGPQARPGLRLIKENNVAVEANKVGNRLFESLDGIDSKNCESFSCSGAVPGPPQVRNAAYVPPLGPYAFPGTGANIGG